MYQIAAINNGTELGEAFAADVYGVGPIALSATGNFFKQPLSTGWDKNFTFQVSGTFVGTISLTGSLDGVNFFAISAIPLGGGNCISQITGPGIWSVPIAVEYVQVAMTSYTSGTATMTARFTTSGTTDYTTEMTRANNVGGAQTTLTTTTETTVIPAVSGQYNDLQGLVIANSSATAVRVDFRAATAGTIKLSVYVPAGATQNVFLPVPIQQTTSNSNWTAQLSAAVSSVYITPVGIMRTQ